MTISKKVAVLVGSLRKDSLNRKMALALKEMGAPALGLEIIEIGQLPFMNQDLEDKPPAPWVEFRDAIRKADGVLFVTPEYNRSVPGVLKNAIDVGSRPYGQSVWEGKPAAIVSVSPGRTGGFGANHHLRQMFVSLNLPTMQTPEAYIGGADKIFDESSKLTDKAARDLMGKFLKSFDGWIDRTRTLLPAAA